VLFNIKEIVMSLLSRADIVNEDGLMSLFKSGDADEEEEKGEEVGKKEDGQEEENQTNVVDVTPENLLKNRNLISESMVESTITSVLKEISNENDPDDKQSEDDVVFISHSDVEKTPAKPEESHQSPFKRSVAHVYHPVYYQSGASESDLFTMNVPGLSSFSQTSSLYFSSSQTSTRHQVLIFFFFFFFEGKKKKKNRF
jgi:hypothetical protein